MAHLPQTGFVPGQDIPVTVELENPTTRVITAVTCELIKVATFHAMQGSKGKSREDRETVVRRELGTVETNGSKTWIEQIQVPSLPPSKLNGCEIIELEYFLDVRAKLLGPHKDMVVHLKIVLGTVPHLSAIKVAGREVDSNVEPTSTNKVVELPLPVVSSEKIVNKPLTPVEEEPAILPVTPVTEGVPTIVAHPSVKGKFTVIPLSEVPVNEPTMAPLTSTIAKESTAVPFPVAIPLPPPSVEESPIIPAPPVNESTSIPLPSTKLEEKTVAAPLKNQETSREGGDTSAQVDGCPNPTVPLPLFEECVLGPSNIVDETDSEHTQGQLNFTPRYPTYQL